MTVAAGPRHVPVLLAEVLTSLALAPGARVVDGTFGAGGYARAVLEQVAGSTVLAIDRDPTAIGAGRELEHRFAGRLTLVEGRFGDLEAIARAHGFAPADAVMLDVGVSSMQLDEAARGFSFQADGPLDMRMSAAGPSAADLVNTLAERELADLLFELGEERRSRAIARAIAKARAAAPLTRTLDLVGVITSVLGGPRPGAKHPATRTFQALRIAVNDELGELERGLAAAERVLVSGGRLAVVTFHSLEDRIVKRFMRERSGQTAGASRHAPPAARRISTFEPGAGRPVGPDEAEITVNPRARSARLRVAVRSAALVS
jgi:16S rRNA (cytosine1402-N4)-methyltransferase